MKLSPAQVRALRYILAHKHLPDRMRRSGDILSDQGLVAAPGQLGFDWGVWLITDAGRDALDALPARD